MPHPADNSPEYERPTGVRWLVFALACGTSWFLYVHRYTWNIVRPQLQEEYGFNNTELEALGSLFYLGYTVFQVPSGIVSDLFGPHLFLAGIIILWAVVLPLWGLTGNLGALGGLRFVFGSAQAGGYPALGNVTRTWFPLAVRTRVQGWIASFFGRTGGAMSSILMSSLLMGWLGFGWRGALVVLSVVGVLFGLAFLALFRNSPAAHPRVNAAERRLIQGSEAPLEGKKKILSFREALKNPALRMLVFQQFCNAGADVTYTNLTGSYFASKGIDLTTLGILVSLPLFGGALGGVVGGYLNDWLIQATGSRRWGRAWIGFTGKFAATGVLYMAITLPTPLTIAWGLFVVKFFADWTQPTVWGTCTDIGGRHSATVFSINNTSGNIGAMILPVLVVGPLLDHFTTKEIVAGELVSATTNFTPVFVLMGVLYLLSAVSCFKIDCTRSVEQ